MKRYSILIVFLLFNLYCSNEKKASEPAVEIIDGVEYVRNSAEPMFPEKAVVLEFERGFSGEDKNGDLIVSRLFNFNVDDRGNIYFSEFTDSDRSIKMLDSEGNFVKIIGSKGQGPGEFLQSSTFGFLPNGNLIVLDYRNYRTAYFDKTGVFLRSHKWNRFRFNLFLAADSVYVSVDSEDGGKKRKVKLFSNSGQELLTFFDYLEQKRYKSEKVNTNIPFTPSSIIAGDIKNLRLYHCTGETYNIDMYDLDGNLVRKITRPYDLIPLTRELMDDYWQKILDTQSNERIKEYIYRSKKEVPVPDNYPVTGKMLVDNNCNLWVQTYEKREENNKELTAYDIFNEKGFYIAKIWIEPDINIIKNGRVYSRQDDIETGLSVVKRYNIKWID